MEIGALQTLLIMKLEFLTDNIDLQTMNTRDLMNLSSHISTYGPLQIKHRVLVTTKTYESDPTNELMCRVVVKIQAWIEKESGNGEAFYWVCNRAKDFSCSSGVGFLKYPPMPFDPTMYPDERIIIKS